jgi:hypothetical protein
MKRLTVVAILTVALSLVQVVMADSPKIMGWRSWSNNSSPDEHGAYAASVIDTIKMFWDLNVSKGPKATLELMQKAGKCVNREPAALEALFELSVSNANDHPSSMPVSSIFDTLVACKK